jgi:hypothetical protein
MRARRFECQCSWLFFRDMGMIPKNSVSKDAQCSERSQQYRIYESETVAQRQSDKETQEENQSDYSFFR